MSVLYKKSANETVSVIPDMNNIDDTQASASTTYSSDKINDLFTELANPVWGFIEHLDMLAPSQRIELTDACANYTPVTVDKTNGTYDLGSWYDWEWLKKNKPYMVHADGSVDYELSATDYTKKVDGETASDVENTAYDGGAFSWGNLIYKYEKRDNNKRIVKFSMVPRPGFEPVGFVNPDGTIVAGRWIPMFYASVVDGKATSIAGTQPSYSIDTDAQRAALVARNANTKFFGGAFVETLIDICYMLAGTTEIQGAWGTGNMSGYNASDTYKGVKANAVVGGGQFYGTSNNTSLNKIFHSIVLGTYQQWMRDPYELVVAGRVKVSKDYTYDLTGATYTDTGVNVPNKSDSNWGYPIDYITVADYGSVPDITKTGGSTSTGVCDGTYTRSDQSSYTTVLLRFGHCNAGACDGLRARHWNNPAGSTNWHFGFAALLDSSGTP